MLNVKIIVMASPTVIFVNFST